MAARCGSTRATEPSASRSLDALCDNLNGKGLLRRPLFRWDGAHGSAARSRIRWRERTLAPVAGQIARPARRRAWRARGGRVPVGRVAGRAVRPRSGAALWIGRGTATDGGSRAARCLADCGERTAVHVTGPSRARKHGWAAARAARCPSSVALAVACPGLGVTPCIEPESALPRRSRRGLRDASATEGKKRVGLLPSPDLWAELLTYMVLFVKSARFGLAWKGRLRSGSGAVVSVSCCAICFHSSP